MDSPLTDKEEVVRKYLQERYIITNQPFTVTKFDAREGEHYLVKVEKNEKTEFVGTTEVAVFKYCYLSVEGRDYRNWKKIYLRKYKLIKIKNNVKIQ
jgi:hypothetical protein